MGLAGVIVRSLFSLPFSNVIRAFHKYSKNYSKCFCKLIVPSSDATWSSFTGGCHMTCQLSKMRLLAPTQNSSLGASSTLFSTSHWLMYEYSTTLCIATKYFLSLGPRARYVVRQGSGYGTLLSALRASAEYYCRTGGSMQLRLVLPLRFRLPRSKIDFLQGLEPGTTESAQGTVFFRLLKFVRLACSCTFSILRGRIILSLSHALPRQRKSAGGHCFASIRSSGRFCQVLMTRYGPTPACRWR